MPKSALLKRLKLLNYKSFASAEIEFDNPVFVVGRNGSGKSGLLDSLEFLSECMTLPLSAALEARGGLASLRHRTPGSGAPRNMGLSVRVDPDPEADHLVDYAFELAAERDYGYRVAREQGAVWSKSAPGRTHVYFNRLRDKFETALSSFSPQLAPGALCLPLAGSLEAFAPLVRVLTSMRVYSVSPEALKEFQEPDAGYVLHRDARNAASVLREIGGRDPDALARIGELLSAAVPLTAVGKTAKHGRKLGLQFVQKLEAGEMTFEGADMSDGTLRLLGILLAVFQRQSPSVLAIDEAELGLHPGALGVVLDVIKTASEKCQVVVSTQSPELLDSELAGAESLRIVEWEEGASRISVLAETGRQALTDHLMSAGGLMRANQIRSRRPEKSEFQLFA